MERAPSLLSEVLASGAGAFVADSAPVIYRVERRADEVLVAACDPLFDAVERGELGCLVSAVSVAELLIEPFRLGPGAVSTLDAFLRQPMLGIAELDEPIARGAAQLVARGRVGRLPDALIAATAIRFGLPLVTNDRRLAATGVANVLLVTGHR